MSVLEAVKEYKTQTIEYKKNVKVNILKYIGCFSLGFFYSLAGVNKEFSPFGVAFAGSVSQKFTITATLGAALGYFIALDSVTALRYMASILALCVIMISLNSLKQIRNNTITPVVVTGVCLFVTSIAVAFSKNMGIADFLICLSESAIGAAATFLFIKAKGVLTSKIGLSGTTSKGITAVIISVMLLLMSINSFSFLGIYPSHIIVGVLVLISGFYGREAGGAIVGICGGIAEGLRSGDFKILAFFAFGGLLSGAFSNYGRIVSFLGFFISGLAVSVISFDKGFIAPTFVEAVISFVIFFAVTKKYNDKLEELLLPGVTSPVVDSIKFNIIKKLKKASEFSGEICDSLNSVNDALSKTDKKTLDSIPNKVREQVCGSCGLYDSCWGESKEQSLNNFRDLLNLKKDGKYLEYKTVPQNVASTCIRTENLASCFNKLYGEYKVHERMETRVKEIHTLASEQFINVSALLDSVCEDVKESVYFDMDTAAKVRGIAVNNGFEIMNVCCTISNIEKMTLEIEIKKPYDKRNLLEMKKQAEIMINREFELPEKVDFENYIKLIYKEKAEYKVVSAGVQYNSNGEKYCGDTYSTFEDDKGYFYAVICDGMGTGVKAAIGSSLAVTLLEKLIKAGFSIKSSIRTVNTSLISKSGEEGSVTLDLFVFDLYTGRAEFYKCGAPDTVVKRKNKVVNLGFDSLPLGIIKNTEGETGTGTLYTGDVVIMCSDGVREEDYYVLRNEVKKFEKGNVRNFTSELSEKIRRLQPQKNDDMTVLTLAIIKNR